MLAGAGLVVHPAAAWGLRVGFGWSPGWVAAALVAPVVVWALFVAVWPRVALHLDRGADPDEQPEWRATWESPGAWASTWGLTVAPHALAGVFARGWWPHWGNSSATVARLASVWWAQLLDRLAPMLLAMSIAFALLMVVGEIGPPLRERWAGRRPTARAAGEGTPR